MTPARMAEIHAAAFKTQRAWSEDEFSSLLIFEHSVMASQGNASFALGRVIAGEAELLTIATHPDQAHKGLGKTCLADFLNACRDRGTSTVFLEVDAVNSAAIALYLSAGFQETARRMAYYTHPDGNRSDAIVMTLDT